MVEDDFEEQFLKANANVDHMSSVLGDFLRNCMRVASSNGNSSQTYAAMEDFKTLFRLIGHSEGVKTFELIDKAIEQLQPGETHSDIDRAYQRAAWAGVKYLTESSAGDAAAKGRSAQRQRDFQDAISRIEDERDAARARFKASLPAKPPSVAKRSSTTSKRKPK